MAKKVKRKVTRVKKTAGRKKPARKAASAKRAAPSRKSTSSVKKGIVRNTSPIKTAYSKSQLLGEIAEEVGLKKGDVKEVFESLNSIIHRHMKSGGAGEFNMPGLLKCRRIQKKATKARKGINPFTGEETTFKAKPARNIVKVRPLKGLKEMVS